MRIERESPEDSIKFANVSVSTVFDYQGDVYMKIFDIHGDTLGVNLANGVSKRFSRESLVTVYSYAFIDVNAKGER